MCVFHPADDSDSAAVRACHSSITVRCATAARRVSSRRGSERYGRGRGDYGRIDYLGRGVR